MHLRYPNGLFPPPADHPETEAVNSPMQKYFQSVRHTSAYNLRNCDWIAHTCVPAYLSEFVESGAGLDEDSIEDIQNRNGRKYNSVWLALKRAHRVALKRQTRHFTVAIPEVQVGGGDFTPRDDAVLTLGAILDFFNHPEWGMRRRNSIDRVDIVIDPTSAGRPYVAAYEFAWFKMNMHVPACEIPRSSSAQIGGLERPFPVTLPQLPILNPDSESEYGSIPSTPRLQPRRRFSVLRPPLPQGWAFVNSHEEIIGDSAVGGSEQDGSTVDSTIDSGGTDDNAEDQYGGEYPDQEDLFGDEPSPSASSDYGSTSFSLAILETQNAATTHEERRDSQWLDVETLVSPQVADTPVMFTPVIGTPVVSSPSSEVDNEDPGLEERPAPLSSEEGSRDNTSFAMTPGVQSDEIREHEWEEIGDHELDSDFESTADRDEAFWSATVREDTDREMVRQDLKEEIKKVFEKNPRGETLESQITHSGGSWEKLMLGNKEASAEENLDHVRMPDDQVKEWYGVAKATAGSTTAGKSQGSLGISGIIQMSANAEIVEAPRQPTKVQPHQKDRNASLPRADPSNIKAPTFPQPGRYLREQAPSPDTPIKEQFSPNTPPPTSSPTQPAIPELVLSDPAHAKLPPKLNPDMAIVELSPKRNPGKLSLPALDFPEKSSGLKEPRPSVWGMTAPESLVVEKSALANSMEKQGLNEKTEFKLATFKTAERSAKGEENTEEGTPMSPTAKPIHPAPSQTSIAVSKAPLQAHAPPPNSAVPAPVSKRKRRRISKEVEMLADQAGLDGEYWAAWPEKRKRQRRGK